MDRCLAFLAEGEGDRESAFEIQGFRAKLASLPDIDWAFEGRATGSGGRVSGTFTTVSWDSEFVVPFNSSADTVKRETAIACFSLDRCEVRRKISFPAATSSFEGNSVWVGEISDKVLRNSGRLGSVTESFGR